MISVNADETHLLVLSTNHISEKSPCGRKLSLEIGVVNSRREMACMVIQKKKNFLIFRNSREKD